MRRPRNLDFDCPGCRLRFDRLVETGDDGQPMASEHCSPDGLVLGDIYGEPVFCGSVLVVRNTELVAPVVRDGRTALDRCRS